MTRLADAREQLEAAQAYYKGGEDGYWAGFKAGVWAMTRACNGEDVNLDAPQEFNPLGSRWYPIDHANLRDKDAGVDR